MNKSKECRKHKVYICTIDDVPVSCSKWVKQNWKKYENEKNKWYTLLWRKLGTNQPADRKITIVQFRNRLFDPINLPVSVKYIVDVLQRYIRLPRFIKRYGIKDGGREGLGWIETDKTTEVVVSQVKSKNQKTIFIIEDILT